MRRSFDFKRSKSFDERHRCEVVTPCVIEVFVCFFLLFKCISEEKLITAKQINKRGTHKNTQIG